MASFQSVFCICSSPFSAQFYYVTKWIGPLSTFSGQSKAVSSWRTQDSSLSLSEFGSWSWQIYCDNQYIPSVWWDLLDNPFSLNCLRLISCGDNPLPFSSLHVLLVYSIDVDLPSFCGTASWNGYYHKWWNTYLHTPHIFNLDIKVFPINIFMRPLVVIDHERSTTMPRGSTILNLAG